jgi:hypothetical protein
MAKSEMADATSADRDEIAVVTTVGDLSVETTSERPEVIDALADPATAYPAEAQLDDGGDVAGRDPDAIAREIEQTRAELADTIDAIADRINPKRAAARSAQAVKAQVTSARDKVIGDAPTAPAADEAGETALVSRPASSSLPIGPIAAVAGVVLVIALFLRRRRSH